ncbi:hypothetical protein ABPG75_006186 [Micractinium tetrahymenae]
MAGWRRCRPTRLASGRSSRCSLSSQPVTVLLGHARSPAVCTCCHYPNAQKLYASTHALQVLSYHVSPDGALEAADLENNQDVPTLLDGQGLVVALGNGTVLIKTTSGQEAKVVKADLDAGSGVVHLVDAVLLPGEEKPASTPEPAPIPSTPTRPPCNYMVKAGDSLFAIGQWYGLTVDAIVKLNPKLKNPELIQPGDVVVLRRCRKPARKALL